MIKRVLAGLAVAAACVAPAVAHAQEAPVVTLLHGIPGATVDIAVDGTVLLPGFAPGNTQDLSSFAGQTLNNVEVRAAGSDDVLIGPLDTLEVPGAGNWTIIAHLDADGNPTINAFENNTSPTPAGMGRLTVRHTAAAPAVDVTFGEEVLIENASNGDSAEVDQPVGEVSARVGPAGGAALLNLPPASLAEGTNLIIYAVGAFDNGSITFYTQELQVGTAEAGGDEGDDGDDGDEGDEGDDGDGTPAPTEVNTGAPIGDGSNVLGYSLTLGALALAGGALALRRRAASSA